MRITDWLPFNNSSTKLNEKHKVRQIVLVMISMMVLALLLISCKTCPKSPKVEYVAVTSDLSFPIPPKTKAKTASELTEVEYQALVQYIIEAEKVFDIIASREVALENGDLPEYYTSSD